MSREPKTPREFEDAYRELRQEVDRLTADKNAAVRECLRYKALLGTGFDKKAKAEHVQRLEVWATNYATDSPFHQDIVVTLIVLHQTEEALKEARATIARLNDVDAESNDA